MRTNRAVYLIRRFIRCRPETSGPACAPQARRLSAQNSAAPFSSSRASPSKDAQKTYVLMNTPIKTQVFIHDPRRRKGILSEACSVVPNQARNLLYPSSLRAHAKTDSHELRSQPSM